MSSRLQEKYKNEVVPALVEKFGYKNVDGRFQSLKNNNL